MTWPSPGNKGGEFAAETLAAYADAGGDMLIYGADYGICADSTFYQMLSDDWIETETAPNHLSWWMVDDRLSLYQRKDDDAHQSARKEHYALMA